MAKQKKVEDVRFWAPLNWDSWGVQPKEGMNYACRPKRRPKEIVCPKCGQGFADDRDLPVSDRMARRVVGYSAEDEVAVLECLFCSAYFRQVFYPLSCCAFFIWALNPNVLRPLAVRPFQAMLAKMRKRMAGLV